MPNPFELCFRTDCEWCGERMSAGENCFYIDGDKVCESCAEKHDYVCECGAFKKPEFEECYDCETS